MSKVPDPAARDARTSFHAATMSVYVDLGALIDVLKKEPDLRVALLALDSVSEHRAPERGDSNLVVSLKHAVGHLLESLNTVVDLRKEYPQVGSAFWRGRWIDRTWGAIGSGSHHDVVLYAAEAMLEPDAAGAAQSGRKPSPGAASGVIRRKVIEAAIDPESWGRLADNLEHEYRSASLLPHSPTGEPKPPEESSFADAMDRYGRSCDEMRTVRLNPCKVIPVDQWPEETQVRGSAIVRGQDWKKYVRYVLSVAAENERDSKQARLWWTWWETTQIEPTKAGPAPLVSPRIEEALRIAATQRRAEASMPPHNNEGDAKKVGEAPQPAFDSDRILRTWRAAAKKWRGLVPPIITALDGTRLIDHPPFEVGPLPTIHSAALELADASDEVAKLAKREHVSAASVLRLAAALRDSPGLPTLDQVDLAVEVERVLLVEIALEAPRPVRPQEPVPMTPVSEPAPETAESKQDSGRSAATNTGAAEGCPSSDSAIDLKTDAQPPEFSAIERAITLLLRDGRNRKSMRKYAEIVDVHHTTLGRSDQWRKAWSASEPSPAELPNGTKDAAGKLEAWKDDLCENCRQEPITSMVEVKGEAVRVCEECAKKLALRTKPRTT